MIKQNENTNNINKLIGIVRHLRSPSGCPWDKKQTHQSLKPMLVEECAELLDAIDEKDDDNLREELGDILMHIVFHSIIAEEEKRFTFNEVVREIAEKMERRHPHIFGKRPTLQEADQVVALWEEIKAEERSHKRRDSILSAVPKNLPALLRAKIIQEKAAAVGFDWTNQREVLTKINEELKELMEAFDANNNDNIEEEIGDLLFSIVNICRFRNGKTAEELLHNSTNKFEKRFKILETILKSEGKNIEKCSLDELDRLWRKAKKKDGRETAD